MQTVLKNIKIYADDYLIVDGTIPIVTNSSVLDELTLYCLTDFGQNDLLQQFEEITKRNIKSDTDINTLSFGQKIIFATLCSIYSSATKVQLRRVFSSIDNQKTEKLNLLIENEKLKGREFFILNY
jgi:hypothetical protein